MSVFLANEQPSLKRPLSAAAEPPKRDKPTPKTLKAAAPKDTSEQDSLSDESSQGDHSGSDNDSSEAESDDNGKLPAKPTRASRQKKAATPAADSVFKMPARKKTTKAAKNTVPLNSDDLWQAIQAPRVSIQLLVINWVKLYNEDADEALLRLVNMIVHSTGCPGSLNKEQFADQESVADWLEELQNQFDPSAHYDYPLYAASKQNAGVGLGGKRTAKTRLRDAFLDFFTRLIASVKDDMLFDERFTDVLYSWTITMSSSAFRPFRHTATILTLHITSQLAEACHELTVDLAQASRQIAAETGKKASGTRQSRASGQMKQMTDRESELKDHRLSVEEMLKTMFDSVFVHRYRDIDPLIRRDCIVALAHWIVKLPDRFLDATYVRYLGWMLSDSSSLVRLDLINSMCTLYEDSRLVTGLRAFTERFKPRMLEIALEEAEVDVQVAAVKLCSLIIRHGTFDTAERMQLCTLSFHAVPAVRSSIGELVATVFRDDVLEDALAPLTSESDSAIGEDDIQHWASFKALADFIQQVVDAYLELEHTLRDPDAKGRMSLSFAKQQNGNTSESSGGDSQSSISSKQQTTTGVSAHISALVATFVDATASHMDIYKQWVSLGNYLCADLSDLPEKAAHTEVYNVNSDTESVLLSLFQVILEHIRGDLQGRLASEGGAASVSAAGATAKSTARRNRDDNAPTPADVSRHLVSNSVLAKLLLKYAADTQHVCCVLRLARMCDADVWAEVRMVSSYEGLLDDIRRLFFRQAVPDVLADCCETWAHFATSDILSTTTKARLAEVQERVVQEVTAALQETLDAPSDNAALDKLSANLLRLQHLVKCFNMLSHLGAADSDGQDLISLLRTVGEKMQVRKGAENATVSVLTIVLLYLLWSVVGLADEEATADAMEQLVTTRDWLIDSATWLLLNSGTMTKQHKRQVFAIVSELYILLNGQFTEKHKERAEKLLCPILPEDQGKLSRYIEQDILRNARDDLKPYAFTVVETEFIKELTQWAKLLVTGLLDYKYVTTLLAGFGSYSPHYDAIARYVLQASRSMMQADEGYRAVATEVFLTSIKRCFDAYLQRPASEIDEASTEYAKAFPDASLQLARLCHAALRNIEGIDYAMLVEYGGLWMIEKLGENRNNAERRDRLPKFSRPLKEFVGGLTTAQAREILRNILVVMQENRIEVASTGKDFEALLHALAKKANVKPDQLPVTFAPKAKASRSRRSGAGAAATTVKHDDAAYSGAGRASSAAVKRNRPSRTSATTKQRGGTAKRNYRGDEDEDIQNGDEEEEEDAIEDTDLRPRSKKPTRRGRASAEDISDEEMEDAAQVEPKRPAARAKTSGARKPVLRNGGGAKRSAESDEEQIETDDEDGEEEEKVPAVVAPVAKAVPSPVRTYGKKGATATAAPASSKASNKRKHGDRRSARQQQQAEEEDEIEDASQGDGDDDGSQEIGGAADLGSSFAPIYTQLNRRRRLIQSAPFLSAAHSPFSGKRTSAALAFRVVRAQKPPLILRQIGDTVSCMNLLLSGSSNTLRFSGSAPTSPAKDRSVSPHKLDNITGTTMSAIRSYSPSAPHSPARPHTQRLVAVKLHKAFPAVKLDGEVSRASIDINALKLHLLRRFPTAYKGLSAMHLQVSHARQGLLASSTPLSDVFITAQEPLLINVRTDMGVKMNVPGLMLDLISNGLSKVADEAAVHPKKRIGKQD
ncbi:cohesin complex subunit [Sorochytrium milnesiophthora]